LLKLTVSLNTLTTERCTETGDT